MSTEMPTTTLIAPPPFPWRGVRATRRSLTQTDFGSPPGIRPNHSANIATRRVTGRRSQGSQRSHAVQRPSATGFVHNNP